MLYQFKNELTVAEAAAGYDFGSQSKVPQAFIHTGGGVLSFVDGDGIARTFHADAGRAYPVTVAKITNCTGEGYVQLFPSAADLPGAAGPTGPKGPTSASWVKAAVDAAAGTTLAALPFYRSKGTRKASAVRIIPAGALTASDTTYATITVGVVDESGASVGDLAILTTVVANSNWTALAEINLDIDVDIATLLDGYQLTVAIAKASTGVAVPAMLLQVDFDDDV